MFRPLGAAPWASAALAPALLASPPCLSAEGLPSGAEATVFVRVRGDVRLERVEMWRQVRERANVEVALGSGFFVTPTGYLVTNRHVVDGAAMSGRVDGDELGVDVTRIDVFVGGPGAEALPATIIALDAEHDLALLAVSAGGAVPYLPLGDSDALTPGQSLTAWGFPMGRQVEVGRAASDTLVPSVSSSPGHLNAVRRDDEEAARYLQIDATLNPGNSGGPIVDEDGYAVGVVRMKLAEAQALGFGIPINLVKDFLERSGLSADLPWRYRPGSTESMGWKGLSLQVPDGLVDEWPGRTRWASPPNPAGLQLRIDRVLSPLGLDDIASALLSGKALDGPQADRREAGVRTGRAGALLGSGRGRGQDVAVEFAVLSAGPERVIARFTGPEAVVAYNRALLRDALASLGVEPLLREAVETPITALFEPAPLSTPGAPSVPMPVGWTRESCVAEPPPRVPAPDAALSASPPGDFSVSFRALWWRSAHGAPTVGERRERTLLGTTYVETGARLPASNGVLLLEVRAPRRKIPFVSDLYGRWVARADAVDR